MSFGALLDGMGISGVIDSPNRPADVLVDTTALGTDHRRRGIGRYVRGLISGLQKLSVRGIQYLSLSEISNGSQKADLAGSSVQIPAEKRVSVRRLARSHLLRWFTNELRLADEIGGHCRVFHTTEPMSLRPSTHYKTVATIHDVIPMMFPDEYMEFPAILWPSYYRWQKWRERWKKLDAIIAISQATKQKIHEYLGVPLERISVVYNGLDHSQFAPIEAETRIESVRRAYHLPDSFVLYLGSYDFRKNIGNLIRAFSKVTEVDTLVLAGGIQPRRKRQLQRIVQQEGLESRVQFVGYIDDSDLCALYSAATCLAYPSLAEGFGLQVVEAMAAGCPVVHSNRTSLPEITADAGLEFNPESPQDMAASLRQCLGETELRTRMRDKGLERAAEFSWERCARETLDVYRSLG